MAHPLNLLVIDLETRPDTAILPEDRDPESFPSRSSMKSSPWGFLLARIERDGEYERYSVRKLGGQHRRTRRAGDSGRVLADDRQAAPRLVTWNGRSFDAAVLKQRSLIHGLTAHNWHRTDPRFGYDYRYESNWHCDLMDALSDFGASPRLGLDEAARALGLPGKWNGCGAVVAEQAAAGDYAAIDRYCEGRRAQHLCPSTCAGPISVPGSAHEVTTPVCNTCWIIWRRTASCIRTGASSPTAGRAVTGHARCS